LARIDGSGDRFEALLAERLRERNRDGRDQCPAVATVAAYCERSLTDGERDAVERHLAGCALCRAELAAIARAARELEAARAAEPRLRRWWSSAPLGLAVAGSIAVVVAIGLGREYYNQEAPPPAQLAMRMANSGPGAISDQASRLAAQRVAPGAELKASKRAPAPAVSAGAVSGMIVGEASPPAPRAESAKSEPATTNAPLGSASGSGARLQLAIPAAAPLAEAPQGTLSKELGGAPVSPQASTMMGAVGANAGNAIGGASTASPGQQSPTFARPGWAYGSATSPDGSVRWEFGRQGMIERFVVSAMTATHVPGVTSDLLAGSAPSSSICWIVGRGGTVLRTTDGIHWVKIDAPTLSDLVSVSAQGADAAIVTDQNSRRYATSDGGQTWQAQ
jgi:hypothetical protein